MDEDMTIGHVHANMIDRVLLYSEVTPHAHKLTLNQGHHHSVFYDSCEVRSKRPTAGLNVVDRLGRNSLVLLVVKTSMRASHPGTSKTHIASKGATMRLESTRALEATPLT